LEALEAERRPVVAALVVKPAPAAPTAPGIQPRSAWKGLRPKSGQMTKHRGEWTRITVHHSAKNTDEYPSTASGALDAIRRIQKAQMEGEEHMGDIAYHYLIGPDGTVYEGRSLDWQGAHAQGSNNVDNIGVCLLGHFDEERPSKAALEGLAGLLGELCAKYGIARSRVFGHQDLRSTACPGRFLMPWVEQYKRGKRSGAGTERELAH
jgi:N-acetyl-anhydromuramyl-L-alanine amidase AmpD